MRTDGLRSPRGAISAVVLFLAGLALAWLCFRTAVGQLLPPTSSVATAIDPANADAVLDSALMRLNQPIGGEIDLAEVRRLAADRPLDARPYLILAYAASADGDQARALSLLEAGQRLDPRQRLIHVSLLERYLRGNDYLKSAQQLSVLSRLVNAANSPITQALVLMADDPEMRPAVERTLRQDPMLERSVLLLLARGDVEPARIFALASPRAVAAAGVEGGWGAELVGRLVRDSRYDEARAIWRRIHSVSDAAASAPVFNPGFQKVAATPPFDWSYAAGEVGVASPAEDGLLVEYYGREAGELATQTILLKPGPYRLSFTAQGAAGETESQLAWQVACVRDGDRVLVNRIVTPSPDRRRLVADFQVPADCPAQTLRLHGEAGEFPDEIEATISNLSINPRRTGERP